MFYQSILTWFKQFTVFRKVKISLNTPVKKYKNQKCRFRGEVFRSKVTDIKKVYQKNVKIKGRPNFCLWVTTVEHGSLRYLFNVFESFTSNHRRQMCACVISGQMETATIQHNVSCKCLHCRHRFIQTRFIHFHVDLQWIHLL